MIRNGLRNIIFTLSAASMVAGCGGGGEGAPSSVVSVAATGGGVTVPTATSGVCSLKSRQDWAFSVLDEWYLFPETLPTTLSTSSFTTVEDYIDALTATARSQNRDRFFTFLTSIAGENAFFSSGSSAGFGVRISYDTVARRAIIAEAFEGAPALAAGIDRGTEILAVGTTASNLRNVSDIIAAEGPAGVSNALGPNTAGLTRVLRITDAAGARNVTISKTDFNLTPVSSRYGARILDDNGRRVGYINLRTFISTANPELSAAFANFRTQGVTDFIIDLRYNGGGLVSTADLVNDLLGGARSASDVASNTTFRPSKSSESSIRRFNPRSESVRPVRVAFIGTGSTASASELVMNAAIPYFGNNIALIGANTSGKPVGQIGLDQPSCDDRLRVVAFSTQNANNGGFYYNGLAANMPVTCSARDDITRPLGDASEASVRTALDFIAGRSCTPIATTTANAAAQKSIQERSILLTPDAPDVAQREVPGFF
jgi:carboxyl-terminal processing protease